jgi:hypothetical protein
MRENSMKTTIATLCCMLLFGATSPGGRNGSGRGNSSYAWLNSPVSDNLIQARNI